MSALAAEIDAFLERRKCWVTAEELCLIFHVEPRELRTRDSVPGLCSNFAISGPLGFRHIRHCTDEEWAHFHSRMRGHAISELTRVSHLQKIRAAQAVAEPSL